MNLLVVRTDKLGDFITALPSLYILKKYNPNNKIIVCVSSLNEELARSCEFIDDIIIDEQNSSIFTLTSKLKAAKIDASITLFSNTRVAMAQFLAGIPIRIAPATKIAQIFYNKRIKQRRSQVRMAEFEYNIELTRELFSNIDTSYKEPLLEFKDTTEVYSDFCKSNNITKEVVAFHVGFGGSADANWSLDEYEELIRLLVKENKYQLVLTFGPDEESLQNDMQDRLHDCSVIFYRSDKGIVDFAKLVSRFKLFVSTSTGTYHLASLVGCPTMTFFADSLFASEKRWKAVGSIQKQKHFTIPYANDMRKRELEKIRLELLNL